MTIRQAIDKAIDNGAKHLSLSPRQFRHIKRHLKLTGITPTYRGVKISRWTPPPEKEESYDEISERENDIIDSQEHAFNARYGP